MEIEIIYFLIFFLAILQTIVGVGVLVLGTPLLLILNYNMIEVMNLLLPISITTSFLNYLYLKSNKKKLKINLDQNIKKNFIFIFFPGIFIGLFLVNNFLTYFNFEVMVSIVIFASIYIKWKFSKEVNSLPLNFKKLILIAISIIHGLTNSGGTLLTIFFAAFSKNKKNQTRYSITFYYLILAVVQYGIFISFFNNEVPFAYSLKFLLIILTSVFIGNFIVKYIGERIFIKIIELLALFSAFFLLLNKYLF
jgi:uncharacterized membrane protein YfcA|tara:strand:- start:42 stop:794 length:753 start_codon:yes stop_codon:yes gene_type:complete